MISETQGESAFAICAGNASVDTFARRSHEVITRSHRLQSDFYASKGYLASQQIAKSGFSARKIGSLATVTWPGLFKRVEVDDCDRGVPFLTTSDMMLAAPTSSRFISKMLTPNLSTLIVFAGTLLISRSGTIGNVAIVTADMDGVAVSEDALRVKVMDNTFFGPMYAFLNSQAGQYVLTSSKSGSVIEHLYESDVSSLVLPLLPRQLRVELSRLINDSSELRVKANRLLGEADALLFRQNYLDDNCPSSQLPCSSFLNSRDSVTLATNRNAGHTRLDAPFYAPSVHLVRNRISRCKHWNTIAGLGCDVVLLGKTFIPGVVKVESGRGRSYFTGKELFRNRLIAKTFINSPNEAHLRKLTVAGGTTLVTCAGTVGRVAYVRGPLEGVTVTHDAIRIQASKNISSGYLYAFLCSRLGQSQIQASSYGSVIPRLHSSHVRSIMIPLPDDRGEEISGLVETAFECRRIAQNVESSAFELFRTSIEHGRSYVEAEWGTEY
jgi:type I restriction enzyme S subunit